MFTDVPWGYGNYSRRDRSKRTRTKLLPSSLPVHQPLFVEVESTIIWSDHPTLGAEEPVNCRLECPWRALQPHEIPVRPRAKTQHLFRLVGRFLPRFHA